LENAQRLTGVEMYVKDGNLDKKETALESFRTIYNQVGTGFIVQIALKHGGNYDQKFRDVYGSLEGAEIVPDVGEWACITLKPLILRVVYGDYLMEINVGRAGGTPKGTPEVEAAWQIETSKEAGRIAVENLKVLLG
jgi:hypothetical protein